MRHRALALGRGRLSLAGRRHSSTTTALDRSGDVRYARRYHLVNDVLMPLHRSVLRHYGTVPADLLLVLAVGRPGETDVLDELLASDTPPAQLLRALAPPVLPNSPRVCTAEMTADRNPQLLSGRETQ